MVVATQLVSLPIIAFNFADTSDVTPVSAPAAPAPTPPGPPRVPRPRAGADHPWRRRYIQWRSPSGDAWPSIGE